MLTPPTNPAAMPVQYRAEGDGEAPLPEPSYWRWDNRETGGHGFHPIKGHGNPEWAHVYEWSPVFTADQMRAYRAARPNVQPKGMPAGMVELATKIIANHFTDEPEKESIVEEAWRVLRCDSAKVTTRADYLSENTGMPFEQALELAISEFSSVAPHQAQPHLTQAPAPAQNDQQEDRMPPDMNLIAKEMELAEQREHWREINALADKADEAEFTEDDPLVRRLRGRADFLRNRGEVKTPDLLEAAAKELETQAPAVGAGWQPIDTAPFDEDLLTLNNSGRIVQDYRSRQYENNWTLWMPLPAAPESLVPVQGSPS